ncbi:hypothetical protein PACILC2_32560 [Paenibacillus cisolokensis]|uniref:HTH araC/xylS-type domain-containing protein n=1 Tax=Paenibacillus cisolokensis TaxID=1658519 RepID=A0ABQ4N8W8_9BACL|nr:AraC family transcriptional regulator [Paenibacillus cisolokensis]GIQ64688.1 hypothetical protein PACILC2_32560 [Paenibacillus cisolokensis]
MPVRVHSGIAAHPAGWEMAMHEHGTFEMSVVLEGRGVFQWDGEERAIGPGHVVLIPERLPHTYRSETAIRFGVLEVSGMPRETSRLVRRLGCGDRPAIRRLPPVMLEQYETLFRQWLRTISRPLIEEERFLATWVELLLLFMLQQHRNGADNMSVAASADYIRSNLASDLPIAALARQCGLSESAYRALFKEMFGLAPKPYQQQCRLEEARWLLRATDRSIQSIAAQVGFAGVHSFSAWFQKFAGTAPSDWRRRQQGNE